MTELYNFMFPVQNRDAVKCTSIIFDQDRQRYVVRFRSCQHSKMPPTKKYVRMLIEGTCIIERIGVNLSRYIHTLFIDPNGWIAEKTLSRSNKFRDSIHQQLLAGLKIRKERGLLRTVPKDSNGLLRTLHHYLHHCVYNSKDSGLTCPLGPLVSDGANEGAEIRTADDNDSYSSVITAFGSNNVSSVEHSPLSSKQTSFRDLLDKMDRLTNTAIDSSSPTHTDTDITDDIDDDELLDNYDDDDDDGDDDESDSEEDTLTVYSSPYLPKPKQRTLAVDENEDDDDDASHDSTIPGTLQFDMDVNLGSLSSLSSGEDTLKTTLSSRYSHQRSASEITCSPRSPLSRNEESIESRRRRRRDKTKSVSYNVIII